MHELAIADSVVQVAARHAAGRRVGKVELRVGHLRQVVPSALEFAFELASVGTPVEGAHLELELIPAEGRCRNCNAETVMSGFPLACERCGGLDMEVIAGEELSVEALEVDAKDSASVPNPSGGQEMATIGGRG